GYARKAEAPRVRTELDEELQAAIVRADLDESERLALRHFVRLFDESRTDERQVLELGGLSRSEDGHILVPVMLPGAHPDLGLAMLMERKSEQVYKQTGCRFQLMQRPAKDPSGQALVWRDGEWRTLP
ncbi:MAG TPA: hypothetical protein VFQ34_02460, partial [Nitrospiraceae bacterium]|nr:hypothetical protein [Nitrospiraceae bacterium]